MICYCADDYALNSQISHAVRTLLQKDAIQATSCMTQSPIWKEQSLELLKLKTEINHAFEIGLHLNFTHAFNCDKFLYYSLSELIFKSWSKSLNKKQIRDSIKQQWQLFVNEMGTQPDFIDGHQHIHQFPVIRDILFEFLKEQNFKGWIRNLNHIIPAKKYQFKSKILKQLGAQMTYRLGQKNHIASNPYFAGIYDFNQDNYASLSHEWMQAAPHGTLIMCHPASAVSEEFDEIQNARLHEYQYLNSEQFIQDCTTFDIQRQPMGAML